MLSEPPLWRQHGVRVGSHRAHQCRKDPPLRTPAAFAMLWMPRAPLLPAGVADLCQTSPSSLQSSVQSSRSSKGQRYSLGLWLIRPLAFPGFFPPRSVAGAN